MVELTGDRLLAVAPNPSVDRLIEVQELRPGAIHRPIAVTVVAGGKGFNVARVAASLGVPVTAVGLLGGYAGQWLTDALVADGIVVAAVARSEETRVCTSILDRSDGRTTEVYESGPPVHGGDWARLVETVTTCMSRSDVGLVTVSGSLPPGVPVDGLAQIVDAARRAGRPVAVDGQGAALARALAAGPWLVKVNLDEARIALDPGSSDPPTPAGREGAIGVAADAVRGLIRAGAERAIVTIGAAGSVAALDDGSLVDIRPPVGGGYGVGSGDAFLAGLAVTLLRGGNLREAVVHATACAASSSLVPGAGRLDVEGVGRLMRDVAVETIR